VFKIIIYHTTIYFW